MTDSKKPKTPPSVLTYDDVRAVSPALEHYTKGALLDGLWKRPELSPRDRSVVTVAALIARIQTIEMPFHFSFALDNGVKPANSLRSLRTLRSTRDGPTRCQPLPWRRTSSSTRNWNRSTSTREGQAAASKRRGGGATSHPGGQQLRTGLARSCTEHHGPALPRVVAPACAGTSRPQPCDGECAHRVGTGRTNHVSPESCDGQRPDAATGLRSHDAHRLLRRLAERVFRSSRRKGSL